MAAFLSSNAHIELWAAEKDDNVKKEANNKAVAR
jgi:large subunit ribosomal protein L17e